MEARGDGATWAGGGVISRSTRATLAPGPARGMCGATQTRSRRDLKQHARWMPPTRWPPRGAVVDHTWRAARLRAKPTPGLQQAHMRRCFKFVPAHNQTSLLVRPQNPRNNDPGLSVDLRPEQLRKHCRTRANIPKQARWMHRSLRNDHLARPSFGALHKTSQSLTVLSDSHTGKWWRATFTPPVGRDQTSAVNRPWKGFPSI